MKKLSVSSLLEYIKQTLESEYKEVHVEGEITNLTLSSAGHWYFTLSDQDGCLSAVLFKMDALRNPVIKKLKNGDTVLCSGNIGVYTKRGSFQLITKILIPAGIGSLTLQLEALKKKLADEGLFDLAKKKRIPLYPNKIGIITALQGAALQDFINVYKRRCIWMDLVVIPALVQGKDAPSSLISALKKANTYGKFDVIVFARGGGSLEDLWAFNDENLAREIFRCRTPTVSAVGHQVDFTIADYVADYRAETPTAAAEILTGPQTKLKEKLQNTFMKLQNLALMQKNLLEIKLNKYSPHIILEKLWMQVYTLRNRLERGNLFKRSYEILRVHEKNFLLDEFANSLVYSINKIVDNRKTSIENYSDLLKALNPVNVLNRGYALIRDEEDHVIEKIESFNKLESGSLLKIEFAGGPGKAKKID